MTYKLRFHELALTEWRKLDSTVREPFKKKLAKRLEYPRVPSAALSGMADCYRIKLRGVGYRLVYRVDEEVVFATVIAVGRRDRSQVYDAAKTRWTQPIHDESGESQ
ncbi:MAG TPA: type II toxin-antitoxin system mRNA interferase toxin, RelE/StbE family [Gammaproteobacteria bacterium]|nr:type II toxin-antitoxin system mRNA interferase toxin, RelE/StbE family [Gammaproteobacteria bacterium]